MRYSQASYIYVEDKILVIARTMEVVVASDSALYFANPRENRPVVGSTNDGSIYYKIPWIMACTPAVKFTKQPSTAKKCVTELETRGEKSEKE